MAESRQSLGRRAISGFAWSGLSQTAVQIIQFGVTIVLARLLFPEDFGLVGMAAVFTEAIGMLSGLAMAPAIIQRKNLREEHLSSGFWVGMLAGFFIFIVAVIASGPIARFYGRDVISWIVVLSAIGFVLGSAGGIHRALLTRELSFKKLTVSELGATIASALISVCLAVLGYGPYSLVLGALGGTAASSCILWFLHPWRPKLIFRKRAFFDLFRYSRSVLGNDLVNYLGANVDYLLVGKFLGAHLLGLYTLAYRLITIPLHKVSGVITKVTFPAFSLIQDDDERLRDAYTRTVRLLALVSIPALALLGVTARDLVLVVFGEKWLEAVVAMRILIFVGMLKSVGTLVGSVVLAKGRPDLELKWNMALLPLLTGGLYLGLPYGIEGVAVAYLLIYTGFFPIIMRLANSTIGLRDLRYYRSYLPAVVTSGLMIIVVLFYERMVLGPIHAESIGRLVSGFSIGILVWILSLELLFDRDRDELLEILEEVSPGTVRFFLVRIDARARISGSKLPGRGIT